MVLFCYFYSIAYLLGGEVFLVRPNTSLCFLVPRCKAASVIFKPTATDSGVQSSCNAVVIGSRVSKNLSSVTVKLADVKYGEWCVG